MAMEGILPGAGLDGVLAIKKRWDAVFRTKANEEMVIANDFDTPQGVEMIGDELYIRIIPTLTATELLASAEGNSIAGTLTYSTPTIERVSVLPKFVYVAINVPDHMASRLGASDAAAMEAGLRKQALAAIDTNVDAEAGEVVSTFSRIKGPANLDKVTLLDAQTTLATNAKQHFVPGSTNVHLKYHPSQLKHVNAIAEVANANFRGDSANPNVKGVVLKAWGMTLAETGNILFSGGNYWNMLFVKTAAVLAWNRKPFVKPTLDFELARNIYVEADFGCGEVFDDDLVIIKSAP